MDTALDVALKAIDHIKVTASSHERAFLVEVMGRDCGYLALILIRSSSLPLVFQLLFGHGLGANFIGTGATKVAITFLATNMANLSRCFPRGLGFRCRHRSVPLLKN